MSMTKTSLLLAGLLAASTGFAQTTAPLTKEEAKAAHDRIEATAKTEKKACDSLSGNTKDVCEAEAKAKEKVAKAELKAQQTGEAKDRLKADETKAEAIYEVAKEKCEDQTGDAVAACKREAKTAEQAAVAQAKKAKY